jgi:quercetin dioxygenase-like cupin family protein
MEGPADGRCRACFFPARSSAEIAVGDLEVATLGGSLSHDGHGTLYVATVEAATVDVRGVSFPVPAEGFAVVPTEAAVDGGCGFAVVDRSFDGLFLVGGPVEPRGRLAYIDGCSDTVLVAPVVLGAPCLNFLYVPPRTTQSHHHHLSHRIGVVLSGSGYCVLPDDSTVALSPGVVFVLPAGVVHAFHTRDDELRIIAWHPDSDTGPTDGDHPMLNRTLRPGGAERLH